MHTSAYKSPSTAQAESGAPVTLCSAAAAAATGRQGGPQQKHGAKPIQPLAENSRLQGK